MINKVTKKVVKEVEEVISEEFVCDVCGKRENTRPAHMVGKKLFILTYEQDTVIGVTIAVIV